MSAVPCKRLF